MDEKRGRCPGCMEIVVFLWRATADRGGYPEFPYECPQCGELLVGRLVERQVQAEAERGE